MDKNSLAARTIPQTKCAFLILQKMICEDKERNGKYKRREKIGKTFEKGSKNRLTDDWRNFQRIEW